MFLLSILFIKSVFSQNIPAVCSIVSPNNPVSLVGCVNGTEEFFNTEFPDDFFNEECLCCTPGTDDNPPDNCFFDQTLNSFEGSIICSENFDCCTCGAIVCSDCKEVICNGDQGCLGVDPITINGGSSGAILACNGDISCFRTVVYGELVTDIACNGDISCGNSSFTLNQITNVEPLGGMGLGFTGDKSGNAIDVTANGVNSLACAGDDSCPMSDLDLNCISSGCPLTVNGDRAAEKSTWVINDASVLDTNGDNSVSFTTFTIDMISSGGGLTVSGDMAAEFSTWTVTDANSLNCVGDGACFHTIFDITFIPDNKDNRVEVAGPDGAAMSNWVLINPASISCGSINACGMITLVASCVGVGPDINGCPLSCNGIDACKGGTINVTNVNNLVCNERDACTDSVLGIDCISSGCPVTCGGACSGSVFDVVNSNGLTCNQQIPVVNPITEIVIRFEGTCENSTFSLENNIGGAIICNGFEACQNAVITDGSDGVVTNLNDQGIMCKGERACSDAKILGECADLTDKGCPLMCEGANACVNAGAGRAIELVGASTVQCVGGSIGTTSSPGCNTTFEISPVDNDDFGISCAGNIACAGAIFNINGEIASTSLNAKDIQCDATEACLGTQFNFFPESDQSTAITSKFGCSATSACEGATISFDLQEIDDEVTISVLECTSVDACKDTMISILLNGVLLSEAQINSKISDGTLDINILCAQLSFCDGAKFTGTTITFASISSSFNALFPNAENPKLINQLGTLWVIIIGILVIAIIILVRKNYQYKKSQQHMVQMVKTDKSNKNDKRRNEQKINTEIRYNDSTKDVI